VDALDSAIDAYERAVQRAEGDRHRPGFLGNLANAYRHRFRRAHDPGDLDAAVDAYAAALELETMIEVYEQEVVGSTASPLIAPALANLARSLLQRDGPGDHARADALLDRIAASLEATDPESALFAAREWAEADAGHGRWDRAAEAYQLAQDAADELFRVQIGRRHREARLTPSGSLGARAALACVRAVRPRMAALALERSRAQLLSDALERDRLDLDALRGLGRQDLVERYQDATAALPW
jgi:hypothetical protein